MIIKEEYVDGAHGDKIFLTSYLPENRIKCVVIAAHGLGEFGGRYRNWAEKFTDMDYAFLMHDQRGHGNSPGKKGVVSSYDDFLQDIDCIRKVANDLFPETPAVFYSHSMGGNVVLNYILRGHVSKDAPGLIPISCAVVASPWLRVPNQPPRAVFRVVGMVGRIFPNAVIKPRISQLSRDMKHLEEIDPESRLHNIVGMKVLWEISEAGKYALTHAHQIDSPMLLLCAESDTVVCPDAVRQFAATAGDRIEFKSWNFCHELHNDISRDEVFEYVTQFYGRQLFTHN
jgi:alpha-beta hydrolase superfamily lysophospholipase